MKLFCYRMNLCVCMCVYLCIYAHSTFLKLLVHSWTFCFCVLCLGVVLQWTWVRTYPYKLMVLLALDISVSKSGVPGFYGSSIFNFFGKLILLFIMASDLNFYHLCSMVLFLSLPPFVISCVCGDGHPYKCKILSRNGFNGSELLSAIPLCHFYVYGKKYV